MWAKIKSWVHKHETILVILSVTILLRLPSLFEPYWYGDEGIYLTVGRAIAHGFELYKQIHDNKPPLLYLVAVIAGGNLFWFKFAAMVINGLTVVVFWKIVTSWFGSHKAAVAAAFAFVLLTTLPWWEGNIANAELFFLLPTLAAFWLLLTHKNNARVFTAGLLLGIAALFKMPAILEAGVWPLFWLLTAEKKWFTKSALLGTGVLLPIGASLIYYFSRGSLSNYLIAAGFQNIPYLSSWQPAWGIFSSLKIRAVVVVVLLGGLWIARRRTDKHLLLLALWWLVTLFSALLSGRSYPHYLLQMTGAISVGLGTLMFSKKRVLAVGLFAMLAYCLLAFKFHLYPVWSYYQNFGLWMAGERSQADYYTNFSPEVNRDYQIAQIIMANSIPTDQIFVWGDVPVIYAMSHRQPLGKYTVKYHILDFHAKNETLTNLLNRPPKYLVTFENENELPGLAMFIKQRYLEEKRIENAKIYRRLGV